MSEARPYSPLREELRRAWLELRGGEASARRLALAAAAGLFIGSLPIFGCHTPLVLGLCLWLQLDGVVAWLAANVSNPFFAPALLTLEVEVGSYLRTGAWVKPAHAVTLGEASRFGVDLACGAPPVALAVAVAGGLAMFAIVHMARWLRPRSGPPPVYALPDNAPPWVRAVERVAGRYAAPHGRTARERSRFHYVRTKLLGDPVARMIADIEGDREGALGAIVDVGTGRGQLPILLLELGRARSARGFDWDAEKIEQARRALERAPQLDAAFERGDARRTQLPPADTALLIDVLHYVSIEEQDAVLDAVADAVRPGGRIIVREADTERGLRSTLTWLEERIFTFVRMNHGERVRMRPAREIVSRLQNKGFSCEVLPAWGKAPFSNVLVVARRSISSGRS